MFMFRGLQDTNNNILLLCHKIILIFAGLFAGVALFAHAAGAVLPAGTFKKRNALDLRSAALGLSVSSGFACAVMPNAGVRCWGENTYGQLGYSHTNTIGDASPERAAQSGDVSVGVSVRSIATGEHHVCIISDTFTVKCWGRNNKGQLGMSNTTDIGDNELPSSIGTVSIGGTVREIAAGPNHTCALRVDGVVVCWGQGSEGQLGYADTTDVGDDENPSDLTKVQVGDEVIQIAAGGLPGGTPTGFTCALLENGTVKCWGENSKGQLGLGDTSDRGDDENPASYGTVAMPGGRAAIKVVAGAEHACALLEDGKVICWGEGSSGQLGQSSTADIGDNEAVSTASVLSFHGVVSKNAIDIAAGGNTTCALFDDGVLRCWGDNTYGQLGQANTDAIGDDEPPYFSVTVGGVTGFPISVHVGEKNVCVIMDDHSVRCWGRAAQGVLGGASYSQIGDGETPDSIPSVPIGGKQRPIDVAIGGRAAAGSTVTFVCTLFITGQVKCWGENSAGQAGYADTTMYGDNEHPIAKGFVQISNTARVKQLAAGFNNVCALLSNGQVVCWGGNGAGYLGLGHTNSIGDDETPLSSGPASLGISAKQISISGNMNAALSGAGTVVTWGQGLYGALGYAATADVGDDETPASVGTVAFGGSIKEIRNGTYHHCALRANGTMRCWGRKENGQLGVNQGTSVTNHCGDDETPATTGADCLDVSPTTGIGTGGSTLGVREFRSAEGVNCLILSNGQLQCFGWGTYGTLGYNNTSNLGTIPAPLSNNSAVVDVGSLVVSARGSTKKMCALLDTGTIRCWGNGMTDPQGPIGYSSTANVGDAAGREITTAGDLSVGGTVYAYTPGMQTSCAILMNGDMRCWGRGTSGSNGNATTTHIGDTEAPSSINPLKLFAK